MGTAKTLENTQGFVVKMNAKMERICVYYGRKRISGKLNYLGMERGVRKLALADKLVTPEELAVLSTIEVCDLVVNEYELVYSGSEKLGLVKKERMSEYNDIVTVISR